MIRHLDEEDLPASSDIDFECSWRNEPTEVSKFGEIATRWRYQQR